MSALTTIFNFLYVYLRIIFGYIFGSTLTLDSFTGESHQIFKSMLNGLGFENSVTFVGAQPILILAIGVFALGSVLGLVRRFFR